MDTKSEQRRKNNDGKCASFSIGKNINRLVYIFSTKGVISYFLIQIEKSSEERHTHAISCKTNWMGDITAAAAATTSSSRVVNEAAATEHSTQTEQKRIYSYIRVKRRASRESQLWLYSTTSGDSLFDPC